MATKRLRGLNVYLGDITNIPSGKRVCAEKASEAIRGQVQLQSPRGVHTSSGKAESTTRPTTRSTTRSTKTTQNSVDKEQNIITLNDIDKKRPEIWKESLQRLQQFTESNTTFSTQKAFALQVVAGMVLAEKGFTASCSLAAQCTGFSSETIRRWAVELFANYFGLVSNLEDISDDQLQEELESARGKHPKYVSLMTDETFRKEAKQFVLENGYSKGKPNLTLQMFTSWVEESKGVKVSTSSASVWLHEMGFAYKQFSKGLYFDGHERQDVVESRKLYLDEIELYRPRMWVSHSPMPNPLCKPVIRIFHDESTFYANADQTYHWTDGTKQALKQKSLGQAIMVSDFLEEVGGFLQYEDEQARLYLEHQTEGYFNNEKLVVQVNKAISIFERKYPGCLGLFIFDNVPSHVKKPENALCVDKMNVSNGGKQPFMRDTQWNGRVQKMVTDDGIQKGLKSVLNERGVNTDGLIAEKLRQLLREYEVCSDYFI